MATAYGMAGKVAWQAMGRGRGLQVPVRVCGGARARVACAGVAVTNGTKAAGTVGGARCKPTTVAHKCCMSVRSAARGVARAVLWAVRVPCAVNVPVKGRWWWCGVRRSAAGGKAGPGTVGRVRTANKNWQTCATMGTVNRNRGVRCVNVR